MDKKQHVLITKKKKAKLPKSTLGVCKRDVGVQKILTRDQLKKRGFSLARRCPFYG